jgi:hypothetical protein
MAKAYIIPRFRVTNVDAAERVVREHYRLRRPVTAQEIRVEVRSLLRQQAAGIGHDDRDERLWAVLSPYVELTRKAI